MTRGTQYGSFDMAAGISYAPEDPALRKPWKGLVDDKTGYVYYWNPETNITQYEKPVATGRTSYAPVDKYLSSSVRKPPQGRYKHSYGSAKASVPVAYQATRRRSYYSQSDVEVKASVGYGSHTSNGAESIAARTYRRRHEISVTGDEVPQPFTSFEATGFAPEILREGRDVNPDEECQFCREVVAPDQGLGTKSQKHSSGSTSTSQFPSTTFSAQIAQLQAELQQTQQRQAAALQAEMEERRNREAALQAEMEERRQREAAIQAELKEWRRRETEMETRQSEMQQQLTRILQFFQTSSRMFNSLDGMSTPTPVKLESGCSKEKM